MIKKVSFIFIIVFIVLFLFYVCTDKEEELRVRILSNSNSQIDLAEKQIIKDNLEEILNEEKTIDEKLIKEKLLSKTSGLINNDIKVEITYSYYPAKSYDNKFIPSGSYKTLLITIGEGKGNNFWTLLYPEYFNIEFEENNEIEYRFYIVDFFKRLTSLIEN